MRNRDWSSDGCSSDLQRTFGRLRRVAAAAVRGRRATRRARHDTHHRSGGTAMSTPPILFDARARLLHWLMPPLLLAMPSLPIGLASTTSSAYAPPRALHKQLRPPILVPLSLLHPTPLRPRPPTQPTPPPPPQPP